MRHLRPTKIETFMKVAAVVSEQSLDPSSQYGCVLVCNNRIIATGYNSFPPIVDNEEFIEAGLTQRPIKYDFFEHAEENAIVNSLVPLRQLDVTAFILAHPCFGCIRSLRRNNIRNIHYMSDDWIQAVMLTEKMIEAIDYFVRKTRVNLIAHKFDKFDDQVFWQNFQEKWTTRRRNSV